MPVLRVNSGTAKQKDRPKAAFAWLALWSEFLLPVIRALWRITFASLLSRPQKSQRR
jgi:hypothetical protein